MAGSDAVVDVSNVCWSSALPPLGKRSPVWGRLELVIDAWRQLHGPDVQFHLLADESLVHILDDPSGLGELQASGTLITSPVADTKILQLARDHDLHVITRDHFIDYRSAYPWIEQHPDRFHSWETEGGVVNIVPLGISPRSLQEISMAFEVRDLKRTRLDPKNPVHKRILYTRWRCANANCPQSVSWQGQLNAWPMVSATGVARCPTCDQPLVELGPRPHLWEVVVQERESQQELLRFPLEADVPEIIGRGATATAKGIDLSVMEAPFRDSVERVSRLHLLMRIDEVSSTNWRLAVIDLQSTNGTQVERWSGSGGYLPAREVGPDKETYLSVRDRLVLGGAVQLRVSGKRYIMDSAPPNVARSSTAAKSPATINPATIGKSRPLRLAASDPEYLGQYRVLRRLGTGGMGTVYLGEPRVGRRVAIKVLHPEMVANEEARARFAQEVAAARRVSSPNVISIVDADTSAVIPWLAMEYVKGPSLSQAVQENLPLPAPALPVLAVGLARALAAAHDSGIVHRDVKPSNLLLSADGPMLTDFGIASAVTDSPQDNGDGPIIGTPAFMSPEQVTGGLVGPLSDVFGLGAMLAFAATGDPPFGRVETPAAMAAALRGTAPALDGVPAEMAALIAQCLAINPLQRPTAAQVANWALQLQTSQSDEVYERYVALLVASSNEAREALRTGTDTNWSVVPEPPRPRWLTTAPYDSGPEPPEPRGTPAEPSRYLKGQCPDAVRVGEPFSVLVSVGSQATGQSRLLKPFSVGKGDEVLIVLHAPGLQVLGKQRQILRVPPQGNSEPVMFELQPNDPGPCRLELTAWHHGTFLGELAVETTAARWQQQNGEHRDFFAEIETGAVEGAVSLVVRWDEGLNSYRFEFRDEDNPPEVVRNLAHKPGPLVEQLVTGLDVLAKGKSRWDAAQTRDYLMNAGVGLWKVLPAQLREQFWERQTRIRQLTILSDSDAMPWELLYPLDPGHDAGFLVEQFPVTRAVFGHRAGRSLGLYPARFVLPDHSPSQARDEVAALKMVMAQQLADPVIISELTPLLELIRAGDLGLLHFACHNAFDAQDGSAIMLDSKRLFTPTQLQAATVRKPLERSAPTVFINACRSAGVSPSFHQLDGWARQFLEAGPGRSSGRCGPCGTPPPATSPASSTGTCKTVARSGRRLCAPARQPPAWPATRPGWPTRYMETPVPLSADEGLPVGELIDGVKRAIEQANISVTDPGRDLAVTSVALRLNTVATAKAGGGLDFRVPFIGLKVTLGGSMTWENTHLLELTLVPDEPSSIETRGASVDALLVDAIETVRSVIARAACGDDPFRLHESAIEFSFGVTTDESISLGIDGELKDEITHTMRVTIARPGLASH